MANTANASWTTSGPSFTNQVVAFGGKDAIEDAYHGSASFTGDGSTASVTVNWIDGTQTPFFTQANPPVAVAPKLVLVGAVQTPTAQTLPIINVNSITSTSCVITTSAANFPAVAIVIPFVVFPY
jgi:hypothetical protein